jgi:hypothetical protein
MNSWFTKLRKDLNRWIQDIESCWISYKNLSIRFRGFEESKDLTLLHFELPISEILIRPGPSDQGRLIAIDLPLEGNFRDYRVSRIRKGEEETSHREKPVSALSI